MRALTLLRPAGQVFEKVDGHLFYMMGTRGLRIGCWSTYQRPAGRYRRRRRGSCTPPAWICTWRRRPPLLSSLCLVDPSGHCCFVYWPCCDFRFFLDSNDSSLAARPSSIETRLNRRRFTLPATEILLAAIFEN